jgi:ribosomal protein S18 acetylase RimI-like enzyme
MDITVRRLEPGDEAALMGVARRFKQREIEADYARRLLADPLNVLLVAERDRQPLGFVWGYLLQRLDRDAQQLFVYEVDVAPESRRQGVGTALMNHVAACAQAQGLMEAFVMTAEDNLAANALYRATGGVPVDERSVLYLYGNA